MINVIRFVIGLSVLIVVSILDIKYRRVSNEFWFFLGGMGLFLLWFDYHIFYLYIIAGSIIFFYVLFQTGILFGGADAKCMMSIALISPLIIFDLFFYACLITVFSIPFIKLFYYDMPWSHVLKSYKFPFLVSVCIGWVVVFILDAADVFMMKDVFEILMKSF